MLFEKFEPSKPYRHLVAYYWTLKSSKTDEMSDRYRFVPDGYVDWVFHKGTPWQCDFPNTNHQFKTGNFHIFGQIKNYLNLTLSAGDLDLFAVKFHPWVASKLWKIDMHYLTDSCLDLTDLGLKNMSVLQERINISKCVNQKIELIEVYLSTHLQNDIDVSLKSVFKQLHSNTNKLNLKDLGVGMRRLEQRFKNEIGISPKLLYKTFRINSVIDHMKKNKDQSLTQIALQHNFFDQSHLIRDFKQFTGFNPTTFLKSINPDGDILNLRVR